MGFLRVCGSMGCLVAGLIAAGFVAGCTTATNATTANVAGLPAFEVAQFDRPTMVLADGWKFAKRDVQGAEASDFDVGGWATVSVPHTWNAEDGADGGTYYRGPAWYRRDIVMPTNMSSPNTGNGEPRRWILRFGAASLVSDVFLNGQPVGTHRGGYAAFCFDVTDKLQPGKNVLAVRVNSAIDPNVTPLSGDFTVYGGIYRPVTLFSTPDIAISPLDDASPGVYLTPRMNADGSALLNVKTEVRNCSKADSAVEVVCVVRDAGGVEIARGSQTSAVATSGSAASSTAATEVSMEIAIASPHVWNGRPDPYLYSAEVSLKTGGPAGGKLLDKTSQPLGFRTFAFDAQTGFTLNGKPYDIHGVNHHQGRASVGYADTPEMRAEDYRLIHDLGCTGIRLAHYQHGPDEYAWCDYYGLVTWAELALVNRMTDNPQFRENCRQQLRELVKQNYNHPAILLWSMYNEPSVNTRSEPQWKMVDDLVKQTHEMDPIRQTAGAATAGMNGPLTFYMDVTGENRYVGWYSGNPDGWREELGRMKTRYAGKKIGMSEYGAGASINQQEACYIGMPKIQPNNSKWHPEGYQALVHEQAWAAMKEQPWLWGKLVWVMFDFPSDGRREGDHDGINDKGLVTADRKTPKDAYYFYQANWSEQPIVHLTEHRFTERRPGPATIKLYTNCQDPKLNVQGVEVPLVRQGNCIFTAAVTLDAGDCEVLAGATRDGKVITDQCMWNVTPGATTRQSLIKR